MRVDGGGGLVRWLWPLVVALWSSSSSVCAYFITVDAHAEECFFDRVSSGTKLSLMFEVAEGGFLDIDVHVSTTPPRLFPLLLQSLPLSTSREGFGVIHLLHKILVHSDRPSSCHLAPSPQRASSPKRYV